LPPPASQRPKPAVSGIRLVALAPPQDFEIPKAPAVPSIDEAVDEMLAESVGNAEAAAPTLESVAPPDLPSRRGPAQRYSAVFAVAAAALIALAWFTARDRSASAAVKPVAAPTVIQMVAPTKNGTPQNPVAPKAIEVMPVEEVAPAEPARQAPKARKWAWVRPVTPPPAPAVKEPYRPSSL
jgi:hypothetical protein